jgi:Calcineurin-like phosphoesterase
MAVVTVAVGDPQASLEKLLAIFERHDLLSRGRLRSHVRAIFMGDYFDYGPPSLREEAARSGAELLEWILNQNTQQVTILLGNHDLARLCELSEFQSAEEFQVAHQLALKAYRGGDVDIELENHLKTLYPSVVDAETIARDFSCFAPAQRALLISALRQGRMRIAHAHRGALFVHAGVTRRDLQRLNPAEETAEAYARCLNSFFEERVGVFLKDLEGDARGALDLQFLHVPPSRKTGWGRGIFFQRPGDPAASKRPEDFEGLTRARYNPLELPNFLQVVGHTRDKKCRETMPFWSDAGEPKDGVLRSLQIENGFPRYRHGIHCDPSMIFTDGAMFHSSVENYELLDCETFQPLVAPMISF